MHTKSSSVESESLHTRSSSVESNFFNCKPSLFSNGMKSPSTDSSFSHPEHSSTNYRCNELRRPIGLLSLIGLDTAPPDKDVHLYSMIEQNFELKLKFHESHKNIKISNELKDVLDLTRKDKEKLELILNSLKSSNESLKIQLARCQITIDELQTAPRNIRGQSESFQQESREMKALYTITIKERDIKIATLSKMVESLQNDKNSNTNEFEIVISKLRESNYDSQIAFRDTIESLTATITSLSTAFKSSASSDTLTNPASPVILESSLNQKYQVELGALKESYRGTLTCDINLETRLKESNNQNTAFKNEIEVLKTSLQSLQTNYQIEMEEKVRLSVPVLNNDALKFQLRELYKFSDQQSLSIASLKSRNCDHEENASNLHLTISDLEATNSQKSLTIESFKFIMEEQDEQNAFLSTKFEDENTKLHVTISNLEALKIHNSASTETFKQGSENDKEKTMMSEANRMLKLENEQLRCLFKASESKISEKENVIESLNCENKKATSELNACHEMITTAEFKVNELCSQSDSSAFLQMRGFYFAKYY